MWLNSELSFCLVIFAQFHISNINLYLLACSCSSLILFLLFSSYVISDCLWPPRTAALQASLSFTIFWSLRKLMSIESVMPSNNLILCHPLLLLPSIFASIRVFSMSQLFASGGQSTWNFSSSISPSNEYSGWFHLGLTGLISLQSKGLSKVFSSTTVQKHQFFGTQPSLWSNSHICTWRLEKL